MAELLSLFLSLNQVSMWRRGLVFMILLFGYFSDFMIIGEVWDADKVGNQKLSFLFTTTVGYICIPANHSWVRSPKTWRCWLSSQLFHTACRSCSDEPNRTTEIHFWAKVDALLSLTIGWLLYMKIKNRIGQRGQPWSTECSALGQEISTFGYTRT